MRRDDLRALKEQRLSLLAEARSLNERCEAERRDLSADEARRFDGLLNEVRRVDLKLEDARNENPAEYRTSYRTSGGDLAAEFRRAGWPGETAEIGWAEYRTTTWSGSVDTLKPVRREGVGLGLDRRYAWPAFPQTAVDSDVTSVQILRQSARTLPSAANVVRNIDAVTAKPEAASTMELATVSLKQVAAVSTNNPNVIVEQEAFDSIIRNDLALSLNEGLDKLVLDAVAASGFQAPGTDRFLVSVRKAMSTILANGYNPDLLVLTPGASETLDTDQSLGTEKFWTFGPGNFAPSAVFNLEIRVSKTVAAPFVADSQAFGRLYSSPVRLAKFEADSGTTNRTNVRLEMHSAFGVERQNAAVRIAAA
jgi:hypothetical protein